MPKVAGQKRASKSKQVPIVAVVSADGDIQGNFAPEPRRPLIIHLPFRSTEVQFQDGPLVYNPAPPVNPQPYDALADDLYASNAELLSNGEDNQMNRTTDTLPAAISESDLPKVENTVVQQPVEEVQIKVFRTIDVMIDYKIGNETMSLPESTSACCFWCSGQFEGRPVVIPTQEEYGVYTVYGNFCTISCGLAYLLNEHIDPQVRWERQALLHRMYKQVENVQPAPPRESLKFFGGCLSHSQFREIIGKKQIRIDANLPPIISILSVLDTKPIDFYETSLRNTSATGIDVDVAKRIEPGLRLKRSKPLKDKESTLDAVMNLHVKVKN